MGKIEFQSNDRPTLGIEIELGLVDGNTMALSSSFAELAAKVPKESAAQLKPELMQCVVEIITGICETVDDAAADLTQKSPRSKRPPMHLDCGSGGERRTRFRLGESSKLRPTSVTSSLSSCCKSWLVGW